jgi:steroid 5-alpha reductase family enzyme
VSNDPLLLISQVLIVSALWMFTLWLIQRAHRNASLADAGWCAGLAGAVIWYALNVEGDVARRTVVALMVGLYGLRLGGYVLLDRVLGKEEDPRYQTMRRRWGRQEPAIMFGYFLLQAPAIVAFSLPPLVVMQNPRPGFSLWELLGVVVWAVAVTGEAVADRQLAAFRRQPWNKDRVCRTGLWRYSRHPNYFFEWLHWWSYVVMALALPAGNWGATLIGPLIMGWALVKVTGIPLAESQALESRGDDYRLYQATTSAFIPWPPRTDR